MSVYVTSLGGLRGYFGETHHDPRVDVAERAEAEQIGAVLAVVEGVRGGRVDGHRAAVGGGIRLLAGVDLQGLELELSHRFVVMDESVCCDNRGSGGALGRDDGIARSGREEVPERV